MDVRNAEFNHPRLVEVYDAECPWSRDDEFFLSVVAETPAAQVVDFGCGTGRLAIGMSRAGHHVTGIDPARVSLERARTKPGADAITWIEGTSSALTSGEFEVAVMTSHVAQFFVDDGVWARVLNDLSRALIPGGRLTFDSRDPRAREWERWNPTESRREVALESGDLVSVWTDVTAADDGVVDAVRYYCFPDGIELRSEITLRFRSVLDLRTSLAGAGLEIEHIYGGWQREPIGEGDGEFLVVARKPAVHPKTSHDRRGLATL